MNVKNNKLEVATFGGGCFWCTEAIFVRVKGVVSVTSGYSGGELPSPTYEDVSSGATGHAEAIQLEFDPNVISFSHLLEIFFATHNPTELNRQGNDVGTQYRSVIFYHNKRQKEDIKSVSQQLKDSGEITGNIVTQIVPFREFYPAELYHHDYYALNKDSNQYCSLVIDPKIEKLLKKFNSDVKEEYNVSDK